MATTKPTSFELNEEMLGLLAEEFGPQTVATRIATRILGASSAKVESAAKEIFSSFGQEWGQRAVQLGREYPDRAWEVLQEVVDATGEYRFGLFPQRFLEIAYLATQDILVLPILECGRHRLVYQLSTCTTYQTLKDTIGEKPMENLPCSHACLALADSIHRELGIDATTQMTATMNKDSRCEFVATSI